MLEKINHFINKELWVLGENKTGLAKKGITVLQVLVITAKEFVADKCSIRAAALTFYSALSLVPVLAMLFGIAKGFGYERVLKQEILESGERNRDMLVQMFSFAENTLVDAKGGLVAGVGIILLFYTLIQTFGLIESAFNHIWQVKTPRSILRKFTDYLSITLIAPILLVISGSVSVFIETNTQAIAQKLGILELIGPLLKFGLNMIPYVLIWLLFLGIYVIMPNRSIKIKPAFIAAVVAGSIYQLVGFVYIAFQIGVSQYNGIYGSFAAIPLFLVWVQISWTIVLFGGELSNAIQNKDEYIRTHKKSHLSPMNLFKYGVIILRSLMKHTSDKVPFISSDDVSEELGIGTDITSNVLLKLEEKNLVVSKESGDDLMYQPARDSSELNLYYIIESLIEGDNDELPEQHQDVEQMLQALKTDIANSKGNVFLK